MAGSEQLPYEAAKLPVLVFPVLMSLMVVAATAGQTHRLQQHG